jgi:signal peptidase I
MVPTLENGDRVLVLRLWHTGWLRKEQIVVTCYANAPWNPIRHPKEDRGDRYIKRIVGMEGDTVITQLLDLPEPMREKYQSQHDEDGQRVWEIPPGHCFVKGDSFGLDSTLIGPIPLRAVQGIVLMKLRSWGETSHRESTAESDLLPTRASGTLVSSEDHYHSEKP